MAETNYGALERAFEVLRDGLEPRHRTLQWLENRAREIYGEIDLTGKTVLEIGCGSGLFCVWAAACGAKNVVGLEPEEAGSSSGFTEQFARLTAAAGLPGLECHPLTLQDYDAPDSHFDVVISYNSVNHLDEPACMALPGDPVAQQTYRGLFGKIANCMRPGGQFIVWDVGRTNLWDRIGFTNPLERAIEWNKHLDPLAWVDILSSAGLGLEQLSWPSYYPLRRFSTLFNNRIAAYVTGSRFRLQLHKHARELTAAKQESQ